MGYDTTRFVKRKPLREVLIEQGVISGPQLDAVLGKLENGRGPLGQALVAEGLLSAEQLGRALAAQYGLPYEPLTEHRVDPRFYQTIPVELMYRHPFVPLAEQDGLLVIAIQDPGNLPALDELELLLKHPLQLVVSTKDAILAVLTRSEGSSQALKDIEADYRPILLREDERGDEVLSIEKIAKDQSPVVKLVDTIILNALQRRASDIHVEASDRAVHVKYRIDGILTPALDPLDLKLHAPLISRIKVMSELDIAERRGPQDGRVRIRLDRENPGFRVSILPSAFGEVVVIRILDKEYIAAGVAALRLDRLGFHVEDLRRFRRAITEPYGMVLVTGPTGSGKTTSLYAAISEINTLESKVITIEDPVEYQLAGVVQIPVNEKKGLTFARGLRSILRHDPDKIMVGEIRDAETAHIAVQPALTGHLVFTTVHANNVFDVIGRFMHMNVDLFSFVSALNAILAQRLVRNICHHCKRPAKVTRALLEESGLDPSLEHTHTFYEGIGCIECGGTGYKGPTAICQLLDMSDRIRELILDRKSAAEIKKAAREEGMTFMREAAVAHVLEGKTTLREINKVTFVE